MTNYAQEEKIAILRGGDAEFVSAIPGVALFTMSAMSSFLFPVLTAMVNERMPIDASTFSILAGIEGAGGILAAGTAPFWIRRVAWRPVAILSMVVLALGTIMTLFIGSVTQLMAVRLVMSVLGSGPAASLGIAALVRSRNPDKSFGYGAAGQSIIPSIFMFAASLSWLQNPNRLMPILAVVFAATSLLLLRLPSKPSQPTDGDQVTSGRISLPGMTIVACAACIVAAYMAYWAFSERIGRDAQLDPDNVSLLLSLSFFMSFIAGLGVAAVAGRWSRAWNFYIGVTLLTGSLVPVAIVNNPWTFALSVFGLNFFINVLNAVGLPALADIDKSGRIASATPAFQFIGATGGPLLAGPVVVAVGYNSSALVAIGFGFAALATFIFAIRRAGRLEISGPSIGYKV
ncbi:hypothetical protein IB238_22600 [Rhizobium sp. ARZ01]|uniref:hypothetical protein n=1 Tax=Rhizobium sp. ARZ01 TaxID=2769313 RepID=UPI00177F82F0|nr:hypothetical protein [Rhizobium sp. ARZ01]MBD9375413.1 hypothetical protein [Rhizobium sp. ARZ01]